MSKASGASFHLQILEADRPFYDGECASLVFPSFDGYEGIQANHSNMFCAVLTGELSFKDENGQWRKAAVSDGMIKVEDNEVLILVDSAEWPEEIDILRAQREIAEAKEALLQKKSIQDFKTAQARMARAMNRLKIKDVI